MRCYSVRMRWPSVPCPIGLISHVPVSAASTGGDYSQLDPQLPHSVLVSTLRELALESYAQVGLLTKTRPVAEVLNRA